jgi:hypothetical protein
MMRVDAITTCAGPQYAAYLARTLPVWLDTLDSLTVATTAICNEDWVFDLTVGIAGRWCQRPNHPCNARINRNLTIIGTDAFTKHDAHFNKGAALNDAYTEAKPKDWVLSIDCDVLPPPNWREHLADIKPGYFYGCHRSDKHAMQPSGYFQLWHVSDAQAGPFPECYGHAGRYDTAFTERWPVDKRRMLPLILQHLGEPATHWHGPGNEQLTAAMLRDGVTAYRARDERLVAE